MFSISALACVIGILFWNDDHVYTTERFSLSRGLTTYTTGWPVYTAMWGGIMAGIFLISGLLWFFKYDKITPAIGFDEAGIFINCYNIKKTHVSWNQVSEILTADRSASIHLVNPQEIVRNQSSQARRRTLEYALKSGILTIYAVDFDGDFKEFTKKLAHEYHSKSL